MFAYNHYDGDQSASLKKNEELLLEVRELGKSGELAEDFCEHFEALWFDQVSKWRDINRKYFEGSTERLRRFGFEKWECSSVGSEVFSGTMEEAKGTKKFIEQQAGKKKDIYRLVKVKS
jgi:hypothetical protein